MAVSDRDDPRHGIDGRPGRFSRYDLVLTVIPVAFLLAGLASQVTPVAPQTTLGAAALISSLGLVDALFVNPPQA
ncbi:hypothetical protein [Halomicrobium salinisoli]|uniref:hypothetical protein n=1 Tax=Halomicrobium salinisoli TaxID=2878391 RepID=UPI001CF015F5|nr:hypothetical protein [Halomicrobium salinisoli]